MVGWSSPAVSADEASPAEATTSPAEPTPLQVNVTELTPATLRPKGKLTISGTVTNHSPHSWQAINVHPFVSSQPITTVAQLREANATAETAFVGSRLVDEDTFVALGDLEPGQSRSFSITLRRAALPVGDDDGVYWIGVHALGQNPENGRETLGRFRTFISSRPVKASAAFSVLIPVRQAVTYAPDGRILDAERWVDDLTDGRLGRIVELLETLPDDSFTLVVDPALLAVAAQLAQGNPALALTSASRELPGDNQPPASSEAEEVEEPEPTAPSPTPEPGATAASPDEGTGEGTGEVQPPIPVLPPEALTDPDDPTKAPPGEPSLPESDPVRPGPSSGSGSGATSHPADEPSPRAPGPQLSRIDADQAEQAGRWLERFVAAARTQTVLGLPYGDPDLSGLAAFPDLVSQAYEAAATVFDSHDLTFTPAAVPANQALNPAALETIPAAAVVVVSHDMLRSDDPATGEATEELPGQRWQTPDGHLLIATPSFTDLAGPAPTSREPALALRQQLLARAALTPLPAADDPVRGPDPVMSLPPDWDPGTAWKSGDLAAGLQHRWAQPRTLATRISSLDPYLPQPLQYPSELVTGQVSTALAHAAADMLELGHDTAELLVDATSLDSYPQKLAFMAVSHHASRRPAATQTAVEAAVGHLRRLTSLVSIHGTDFVTLSGDSGTLTLTLANRLNQPVVAGVKVSSPDPGLQFAPPAAETLTPGQRLVLKVGTKADSTAVNPISVEVVTTNGATVGQPFEFTLRTSQVGRLIWGVLITSGLIFVVLVIRRVSTAIRERRRGSA